MHVYKKEHIFQFNILQEGDSECKGMELELALEPLNKLALETTELLKYSMNKYHTYW